MRIFSSQCPQLHVERNPGYWLSKRQATTVSRRLQAVLDLTEYQRQIVQQYLRGNYVDCDFESRFAPRDLEAIKGFTVWYDAEEKSTTSYLVANLNTGAICVFIHGGWKPYVLNVRELFSAPEPGGSL